MLVKKDIQLIGVLDGLARSLPYEERGRLDTNRFNC